VDRRLERAPWQIANGSFVAVVCIDELPSTAGTLQFTVTAFPSDPQIQRLALVIDFLPVYAIAGPLKNTSEFVIGGQAPSLSETRTSRNVLDRVVLHPAKEPAVPAAEGQRMAAVRLENDNLAKVA